MRGDSCQSDRWTAPSWCPSSTWSGKAHTGVITRTSTVKAIRERPSQCSERQLTRAAAQADLASQLRCHHWTVLHMLLAVVCTASLESAVLMTAEQAVSSSPGATDACPMCLQRPTPSPHSAQYCDRSHRGTLVLRIIANTLPVEWAVRVIMRTAVYKGALKPGTTCCWRNVRLTPAKLPGSSPRATSSTVAACTPSNR